MRMDFRYSHNVRVLIECNVLLAHRHSHHIVAQSWDTRATVLVVLFLLLLLLFEID